MRAFLAFADIAAGWRVDKQRSPLLHDPRTLAPYPIEPFLIEVLDDLMQNDIGNRAVLDRQAFSQVAANHIDAGCTRSRLVYRVFRPFHPNCRYAPPHCEFRQETEARP